MSLFQLSTATNEIDVFNNHVLIVAPVTFALAGATCVLCVLSLALCYIVLVFFSPSSIAITSLGEERANLSVFRKFVRFAFVWFCVFPLPLGVWEGLRLVIVALPGLFSYFICVFVCPLSIVITSTGEERANLSVFRTFV